MAKWRERHRKDGSPYYQVRYRIDGTQASTSFDDPADAEWLANLIDRVGPAKALEIAARRDGAAPDTMTVAQWSKHHIDHLTGVAKSTIYDYRSYLKNDITPHALADIPLDQLGHDDIAQWVQWLAEPDDDGDAPAAKTIANKHGFLSGALNAAVNRRPPLIAANPAAGMRLPDGEAGEMIFLTHDEFGRVLDAATERWRPLIEFLVTSGARYSEVAALRPSDVDRAAGIVRIRRGYKRNYAKGGYEDGPLKSKRSRRDVSMPASVLDKLDYSGEWLFTTTGQGRRWPAGQPVRVSNFRANGWWPAVEKAGLDPRPRIHDLRHTHASWLLQAGEPITVVSRRMGHKSIQITVDTYGHLDRSDDAAAAARLGNML